MNEPEFVNHWNGYDPREYEKWARENKKRADRLMDAAFALLQGDRESHSFADLRAAAVDYQDTRG